eukprot:scaffold149_cov315-Pinguiococcus_pyrenoidosus.AAC.125
MQSLTEASAPSAPSLERHGAFFYFSDFCESREALCIFRIDVETAERRGGSVTASSDGVELVLALDERAVPSEQHELHLAKPSPCHRFLAFTIHDGHDNYDLRLQDVRTGRILKSDAEDCGSVVGFAWSQNAEAGLALYFTKMDEQMRPAALYRMDLLVEAHDAARSVPSFVFREDDPNVFMDVTATKNGRFVVVNLNSKATSEVRLIANDGASRAQCLPPFLVKRRKQGANYFLEHLFFEDQKEEDAFIVVNNSGTKHPNFSLFLLQGRLPELGKASWTELSLDGREIDVVDIDVFAGHVCIYGRRNGRPAVKTVSVADLRDALAAIRTRTEYANQPTTIRCTDVAIPRHITQLRGGVNGDFRAGHTDLELESLTEAQPVRARCYPGQACLIFDGKAGEAGHGDAAFVTYRSWATAPDETKIPVTIAHKRGIPYDGATPTLLQGYGAYGECVDLSYTAQQMHLLENGWCIAFAHVRGGGEFGLAWHAQASGLGKANSFNDFIAAAEHLCSGESGTCITSERSSPPQTKNQALGITSPQYMMAAGVSAGALLCGVSLWAAPHLFRALLLRMPFLDVYTTMTEYPHLPLTLHERDEWGDPAVPREAEYIASWDPIQNLQRRVQQRPSGNPSTGLPAVLIQAGAADMRAPPWNASKLAALLEALATEELKEQPASKRDASEVGSDAGLLLDLQEGAGHFASNQLEKICLDRAIEAVFLKASLRPRWS